MADCHQLRSYVSCNKPSFDARHRGPSETLVFGCFRRATTHAHTSGQQTARTRDCWRNALSVRLLPEPLHLRGKTHELGIEVGLPREPSIEIVLPIRLQHLPEI